VFARTASEYFSRFSGEIRWCVEKAMADQPSQVRFWSAFGKPPPLSIDVTVATIQGKIAEVNGEAMVLLHSRSRDIYTSVQTLRWDNQNLLATVKGSAEHIIDLQKRNELLVEEIKEIKQQNEAMKTASERTFFI